MSNIAQQLNDFEEPIRMSLKSMQMYTCNGGFFQSSIGPKKLMEDKLCFSIHRRMFRIRKGAEQCKDFLMKSKYKHTGFKGGKISAEQFYKKHASFEWRLDKPKTLPNIELIEQPQKKHYTVYSPKPNFVYNLSLFVKKRNCHSIDFSSLHQSTVNEPTNFDTKPIKTCASSEFRPKEFRNTRKSLHC